MASVIAPFVMEDAKASHPTGENKAGVGNKASKFDSQHPLSMFLPKKRAENAEPMYPWTWTQRVFHNA